uniref:Tudor domain-containing protein n=1 Tax=Macrostomum lignano TaxID=282301 RepID=A0A1I8JLE6_9PLAT
MSDWRRLVNQTYQRLVGVDIPLRLRGEISEDGVWYRAEACFCLRKTRLYFVDYGNAEVHEPAPGVQCNLRQPLFLDEPCLAVRCRPPAGLVATGAAHDDDKQQPPEQKQLWLDVKRRYDDGVRQPDVVLYDDAKLTAVCQ